MFSVCVAQCAVKKGGTLRLQATASKQTRLLVKINGGADRVPEWLLSLKEGVHETRVKKHPPITVRLRGRGGAAALHVGRVTLGSVDQVQPKGTVFVGKNFLASPQFLSLHCYHALAHT